MVETMGFTLKISRNSKDIVGSCGLCLQPSLGFIFIDNKSQGGTTTGSPSSQSFFLHGGELA
jgi:hypothetical protein